MTKHRSSVKFLLKKNSANLAIFFGHEFFCTHVVINFKISICINIMRKESCGTMDILDMQVFFIDNLSSLKHV